MLAFPRPSVSSADAADPPPHWHGEEISDRTSALYSSFGICPPLSRIFWMTCLCSQMFIEAVSDLSPV